MWVRCVEASEQGRKEDLMTSFREEAPGGPGSTAPLARGNGDAPAADLEPLRIGLLGGFRVRVGSRVVGENEWRLRKAASLVKLLALAPGHHLHREQAMDLLWPDLDSRAAANNLHYALHVARGVLDPGPRAPAGYLRLRGGRLQLCPESPLWVDVEAFEEAAATARREREPAAYRAALDLYAGDLLPEDRYGVWTEERREELRQLYLALLFELARAYEKRGEREWAIRSFERVVTEQPIHEKAHIGLMRLYAAAGHPVKAIIQYERLKETFRHQLDRMPDDATRRLYRRILAQRPPTARPPAPKKHSSDRRHNLPAAVSNFIGREAEILEIKRHLSMTRLLTLTGTGGVGKTRLALEVAGDLTTAYPAGVWLVEFAPLSDPDLAPQAVAAALGIREEQGRPLFTTLVEELRSSELLLVLDNCEHLVDACARLVDTLLSSCPSLRVLATSREPLGITGEVWWPVRPLSMPDVNYRPTVEHLVGYESVRLFVDRARTRLPGFELTSVNSGAVAKVCRKLDGIPLAIELATARMTVLAIEQVAVRLDDALELLTGGSRTANPRHQTLRAALEWSYEPLSDRERMLFERLSVFAGGWTLEAAEAVGDGIGEGQDSYGRVSNPPLLDLLGRLVSKSLVTLQTGRLDAARYGMLEPVRQYARERLDAAQHERARERHAMYFLTLAEEAEPELLGPRPGPWLERLAEERDNLRAALSWALDAEDRAEAGLRISVALVRFWGVFGVSEGRRWLEKALAKSGALRTPLRARALNETGFLILFGGGFEQAIAMLEESLALSRELKDSSSAAGAVRSLVYALAHAGDSVRVAQLREEAEALIRGPLDQRSRAGLLEALTLAALDASDYEGALAYAAEAYAAYRALGDVQGTVVALAALGMVSLTAGDPEQAQAYLAENLELLRGMGHKMGIAYCLLGMAGVAGERARPDRAARLWGAAEALREAIGMHLTPFDRSHYRYDERLAAARALIEEDAWERVWAEGRAMSPEEAIEYALAEEGAFRILEQPTAGHAEVLTPREREVAEEVAKGLTNRQVATELGISERTVHAHVRRILRKLCLGSRAQIAAWVIEQRGS
jgi:predicted ATPase/DNA-binding SARP family transcriptional activator/DNA-binding CsgD family transcriptional regulator